MDCQKLLEMQAYLKQKLAGGLVEVYSEYQELNIFVPPEELLRLLFFLRDDPHSAFIGFIDITGVDYPSRAQRFEVVYHLLSPQNNLRLRVKTATDETHPLPSACAVYPGAEWYEREIYDLFGVTFVDHPDLRRILTDYGFVGHPLRKDFPTSGFVECRYDNALKRVIYEPVLLKQEMRNFDFLTPWEGPSYQDEDTELEDK